MGKFSDRALAENLDEGGSFSSTNGVTHESFLASPILSYLTTPGFQHLVSDRN